MTQSYAKIVGTATIRFESWKFNGPYSLQDSYRESTNNGAIGGFAIKLNTSPLTINPTADMAESDLNTLIGMKGEEVTLTIHNESSPITVKIKNIFQLRMLDPTSVSSGAPDFDITTTCTKREVQLELIRET